MDTKTVVGIVLQTLGSLAFLLVSMEMMSSGIQKSAGSRLEKTLSFMTGNRFAGLFTGLLLTTIIQSSSATTVIVVSFVNSGLLTLMQAIPVIFGANIGTTVTAWLVALFGFNFKISAFAIPLFGLGFLISRIRNGKYSGAGRAVEGFALLFLALSWLSGAVTLSADSLTFLLKIQQLGMFTVPAAALIGILLTALIHSSSALTAIVITLAHQGLLTWEFSAGMVIGANIGTTIDSVLAGMGANTNSKRTAFCHVVFNCITALFALILIKPFTTFIDYIVPLKPEENMAYHISMLHTCFNLGGTLIFIPFIKQLAAMSSRFIKDTDEKNEETYTFEINIQSVQASPLSLILKVRSEVSKMAKITLRMFDSLKDGLGKNHENFLHTGYYSLAHDESYLDSMQEELTKALLNISSVDLSEELHGEANNLITVITELESLSDNCMDIGVAESKILGKNYTYQENDFKRLYDYLDLASQSAAFVAERFGTKLTERDIAFAETLENEIDAERHSLKKLAKTRLENGCNVKAELLYLDLARKIERIGDHSYNIIMVMARQRLQQVEEKKDRFAY